MSGSGSGFAVRIEGLEKGFGHWPVLWDLDLTLNWGQLLVLFGANAVGKTTLLRILSVQARPDAGNLWVAGYDLSRSPGSVRRRIGVVGHRSYLYDDLTCRENLVYYGRLFGLTDVQQRVEEALSRVNLGQRADQRVRTLSNGMQKRASIARAILHQPQLLLLDEPEAGLDHESTVMLQGLLEEWAQSGRAAILTTHNVDLGLAWGDLSRVGVLTNGSVHFQEPGRYADVAEFRRLLSESTGTGREI
ncbi:MAG: hypothetical protein BZY88_20345 [SAR202 cluster bacterium Io17-Chloro-G9]|nr:MAG: hypothetical protein BZY88_20345 [SAR202 cluster bacterium Io17-Chloro-G9]